MEYKKYEYPTFNIYTIKTNRFKKCEMEILFREEIKDNKLLIKTFLADLMSDCSSEYKSRKEVSRKLEELYNADFYGITNRVGKVLMTSFVTSFLNPKYANNSDYLEEIIKFSCEMILKPFVNAAEFDIKNFHIVKNRLYADILNMDEDINRVSLKKALSYLSGETPTKSQVLGTIPELEEITPKKLFAAYQELMNNNLCDIFIVGNLDMDEVANHIYKYFKNPVIKTQDLDYYVVNDLPKKLIRKKESSNFIETNLVNIYNAVNLSDKEKLITMNFYNYLLGGGGLNTKLYQLLREKNSLCYGIKSMYLKYDNLLIIETSVNIKDVKLANKLIKEAFKLMNKGDFTLEELENAKKSFIFSLNLAIDSPAGLLNNYVFHVYNGLPKLEERIKLIESVTKEEIKKLGEKIKPNICFVLEGGENGEN